MKNKTKTYEKRVAHDFHFFAFKRLIFVLAYIRISRCGLSMGSIPMIDNSRCSRLKVLFQNTTNRSNEMRVHFISKK